MTAAANTLGAATAVVATGGWEEGNWQPVLRATTEDRRGLAYMTVKRELALAGHTRKMQLDEPSWGDAAQRALWDWQQTQPPSLVPHRTSFSYYDARRLFMPYVFRVEDEHGIPNHYVYRLLSLEAAFYPAAVNQGGDQGMAQVNADSHPDVTLAEAYDARWSITYAAQRLVGSHAKMPRTGSWTQRWWGAILAHNAPAWAADWVAAGCPAEGGDPIDQPRKANGDKYRKNEWCYTYVSMVRRQEVPLG